MIGNLGSTLSTELQFCFGLR